MYNILTLNKISEIGLNNFPQNFSYGNYVNNPDGIIVRSKSLKDYKFSNKTIAIARAGSGVNNISIDECSKKGIVVFNTPGANANSVKELVLASLFLSSRKIIDSATWVKTLQDSQEKISDLIEKNKKKFAGHEIKGKKLGVIGLGSIGSLVAKSASDLGMKVFGFDPYLSRIKKISLCEKIKIKTSIETLISDCDYITLHVPLTESTKFLVDSPLISKMKNGVRLLNFSRAELINPQDLIEGLNNKKISCYITDFPQRKFAFHEKVISLPHIGASTKEAEDNCACMAVEELVDYIQNGNIKNSVNFPDMYMPFSGTLRLCVIHYNVPDVINNISHFLSKNQINIENMQSYSKGNYAYAMLDLNKNIFEELFYILKNFKNIIKIRKLNLKF